MATGSSPDSSPESRFASKSASKRAPTGCPHQAGAGEETGFAVCSARERVCFS